MTTSRKRRRKSAFRLSKRSGKRGSKTLRLNDDWREFLLALISTGTRFLLIGGHAIAVHAQPRFTEDLDMFVEPTRENASRLRAALVEFGFGSVVPPIAALARRGRVWMLGRKPRRIDILTGISGVSFARASRGALRVIVGGQSIRVIGRTALVATKRASGRLKDRLDLELLRAARSRRTH